MTYNEFITSSADTPKNKQHLLQIRHDFKSGWYKIWGNWYGQQINLDAPDFPKLLLVVKKHHGITIPRKKDLIFTHRHHGYSFAMIQGFLPGSCIVDVSSMVVKNVR